MAYIPDAVITLAVEAIITTRDFCGDERQAALDVAADYGYTGQDAQKILSIARPRANKNWRSYQEAAGVKRKYWTV